MTDFIPPLRPSLQPPSLLDAHLDDEVAAASMRQALPSAKNGRDDVSVGSLPRDLKVNSLFCQGNGDLAGKVQREVDQATRRAYRTTSVLAGTLPSALDHYYSPADGALVADISFILNSR